MSPDEGLGSQGLSRLSSTLAGALLFRALSSETLHLLLQMVEEQAGFPRLLDRLETDLLESCPLFGQGLSDMVE